MMPGETDPNPENRPARPDPVDMDEEEKEMLAEARARLANTQGKKAKRKERERTLNESKRLANLQKRKEMIAAGLPGAKGLMKSKGSMNYNVEIPFEKEAPLGVHDVTEELSLEAKERTIARANRRAGPQGKRTSRDLEEIISRKADVERDKRRARAGELPLAVKRRLEQTRSVSRPLQLPPPQISEEDLSRVLKADVDGLRLAAASQTPSVHYFTPQRRLETPLTHGDPLNYADSTVCADPAYSAPDKASDWLQPDHSSLRGFASRYRLNTGTSAGDSVHQRRTHLAAVLARLPAPRNDFDTVVDE